LAWSIYLGRWA